MLMNKENAWIGIDLLPNPFYTKSIAGENVANKTQSRKCIRHRIVNQ